MENLKRITPKEVYQAYATKGIIPIQNAYMRKLYFKEGQLLKCACAFGVLSYNPELSWDHNEKLVTSFMEENYNDEYATGILCGFDGDLKRTERHSEEFGIGYDDGVAIREYLIEKDIEFAPKE